MTDPHTIARGLTDTQAWAIQIGGSFGRMPLDAIVMRPLERRGLFSRIEQKGFQVRWELTAAGEAVRRVLEEEAGR